MDSPRLVIVSNRVPAEGADPGGLVSAIRPVAERYGALWFGWSGATTDRRPGNEPALSSWGPIELATIDLSADEASMYYAGFSNRTLWPLLHTFPERVIVRRGTYGPYRHVNRRFAEALLPLLKPGDLVWAHDFHLFHFGHELRQLGWSGKIGFFLHVPFPPAEVFTILPWARQILEALMEYDVVGFQTEQYLENAVGTMQSELGGLVRDGEFVHEGKSIRVGVYPAGIDPAPFQPAPSFEQRRSRPPTGQRLILGVDRLDYTKGVPERLRAFERLLEHNPSMRGKVTLTQISTPSRTRVPDYIREKEQVDRLVGQINGRFSQANWTPIRYLYRSYKPEELARFYRDAEVFMVTPLRDGMNLIAKEFVASQGEDPGVLLLSRFCGAAESMREALIVNPHDVEGTAAATYKALSMPMRERRERWRALMEVVRTHTAVEWWDSFHRDLVSR